MSRLLKASLKLITREFLDSLTVMEVMEDWGGKRVAMVTALVQKWRANRPDDEKQLIAEALCMLCPGSTFVVVDGMLGVRTDGKAPIAIARVADYIEQERNGRLLVRKERLPELSEKFRACIGCAVGYDSRS